MGMELPARAAREVAKRVASRAGRAARGAGRVAESVAEAGEAIADRIGPVVETVRPAVLAARDRRRRSRSHEPLPNLFDVHPAARSEEHTSELQSRENLVCRLLLEKKKK